MATGPTVFVSHKNEDAAVARRVSDRLKLRGLATYLDTIDPVLGKDGPELGDYLRAKLGECSQLLAVVSPATQGSWWVPWEIGVATEKSYFIATFLTQPVTTPTYLQKWPYLRTDQDLDVYADVSKRAHQEIVAKSQATGRILESMRASAATDFHRVLKKALGQ